MSFRELISKTTIANVVAAVVILASVAYAFYTRNTSLINFSLGAAVGYLLRRKNNE